MAPVELRACLVEQAQAQVHALDQRAAVVHPAGGAGAPHRRGLLEPGDGSLDARQRGRAGRLREGGDGHQVLVQCQRRTLQVAAQLLGRACDRRLGAYGSDRVAQAPAQTRLGRS
ncbi:MAG: hypothetical protein WD080_06850 [Egibacteraceae bacterium]